MDHKKKIEELTDNFARQLTALVAERVAHDIKVNLGVAPRQVVADKPAATAPTKKRAVGEKRPRAEIEAVVTRVHQAVTKNPGLGIEKLGAVTGLSTNDMRLPVQKLLADKKIKKTGKKRATKYFPRQGGGK